MCVDDILCLLYGNRWSPIQREITVSLFAGIVFGLLPLILVIAFNDEENLREEGAEEEEEEENGGANSSNGRNRARGDYENDERQSLDLRLTQDASQRETSKAATSSEQLRFPSTAPTSSSKVRSSTTFSEQNRTTAPSIPKSSNDKSRSQISRQTGQADSTPPDSDASDNDEDPSSSGVSTNPKEKSVNYSEKNYLTDYKFKFPIILPEDRSLLKGNRSKTSSQPDQKSIASGHEKGRSSPSQEDINEEQSVNFSNSSPPLAPGLLQSLIDPLTSRKKAGRRSAVRFAEEQVGKESFLDCPNLDETGIENVNNEGKEESQNDGNPSHHLAVEDLNVENSTKTSITDEVILDDDSDFDQKSINDEGLFSVGSQQSNLTLTYKSDDVMNEDARARQNSIWESLTESENQKEKRSDVFEETETDSSAQEYTQFDISDQALIGQGESCQLLIPAINQQSETLSEVTLGLENSAEFNISNERVDQKLVSTREHRNIIDDCDSLEDERLVTKIEPDSCSVERKYSKESTEVYVAVECKLGTILSRKETLPILENRDLTETKGVRDTVKSSNLFCKGKHQGSAYESELQTLEQQAVKIVNKIQSLIDVIAKFPFKGKVTENTSDQYATSNYSTRIERNGSKNIPCSDSINSNPLIEDFQFKEPNAEKSHVELKSNSLLANQTSVLGSTLSSTTPGQASLLNEATHVENNPFIVGEEIKLESIRLSDRGKSKQKDTRIFDVKETSDIEQTPSSKERAPTTSSKQSRTIPSISNTFFRDTRQSEISAKGESSHQTVHQKRPTLSVSDASYDDEDVVLRESTTSVEKSRTYSKQSISQNWRLKLPIILPQRDLEEDKLREEALLKKYGDCNSQEDDSLRQVLNIVALQRGDLEWSVQDHSSFSDTFLDTDLGSSDDSSNQEKATSSLLELEHNDFLPQDFEGFSEPEIKSSPSLNDIQEKVLQNTFVSSRTASQVSVGVFEEGEKETEEVEKVVLVEEEEEDEEKEKEKKTSKEKSVKEETEEESSNKNAGLKCEEEEGKEAEREIESKRKEVNVEENVYVTPSLTNLVIDEKKEDERGGTKFDEGSTFFQTLSENSLIFPKPETNGNIDPCSLYFDQVKLGEVKVHLSDTEKQRSSISENREDRNRHSSKSGILSDCNSPRSIHSKATGSFTQEEIIDGEDNKTLCESDCNLQTSTRHPSSNYPFQEKTRRTPTTDDDQSHFLNYQSESEKDRLQQDTKKTSFRQKFAQENLTEHDTAAVLNPGRQKSSSTSSDNADFTEHSLMSDTKLVLKGIHISETKVSKSFTLSPMPLGVDQFKNAYKKTGNSSMKAVDFGEDKRQKMRTWLDITKNQPG